MRVRGDVIYKRKAKVLMVGGDNRAAYTCTRHDLLGLLWRLL